MSLEAAYELIARKIVGKRRRYRLKYIPVFFVQLFQKYHPVWKFKNFSTILILREINFGQFWASKTAILTLFKALNFDFGTCTRCGNFRIFLQVGFYVKSMLDNLSRSFKTTIVAISGAPIFVDLVNFNLPKVQIFIRLKNHSFYLWQNDSVCTSRMANFDFT